jgi:hypothetical protein
MVKKNVMSLELSVCAACVCLWGEPVEVRLGARCSSSSSEAVVAGRTDKRKKAEPRHRAQLQSSQTS